MSRIGSYPNIEFKESQKFLVLDPSTSSTSLVLGSDLVAYITPKINSVRAESTRTSAENTDYKVGEIVQTSGATAIGDGLATVYLVVAGGAGDFSMINGNDLLTIVGDDGLRSDLISAAAGKGASIVSMQSGPTVENAIGQGVISWSGTRTYQIGSFANRAGVLYVCKTADHISATAPESDATNWDDYLSSFAPIASPNFTGTPTAPTAPVGTNTTQIATTEMVGAEIANDVGVINSALVKTALNAGGVAPIYASRAWVNFNGVGGVSVRASGNVSSITDNGVGDYTINFSAVMPSTDYSITASLGSLGSTLSSNSVVMIKDNSAVPTTSALRISTTLAGNGAAIDVERVAVSIFI
jgi:hypothetical protein